MSGARGCTNCGAPVTASFCGECGQRVLDPDPTLGELAHELAGELVGWDGKLATTFRLLVTKPGELTREYLAGRRVRYVSPLRVYLTCSVLFFFLNSVLPPRTVIDAAGNHHRDGVVSVGTSTPRELAVVDSLALHAPPLRRAWFGHFARALRDPDRLSEAVTLAIPRTMFVLVPLFAALVGAAYRGRRYPQHLAFALHVHATIFLALAAMLVSRLAPRAAADLIALVATALLAVHLVIATRRVYGGSVAGTVARLAAIGAGYFVAFIGTLYVLFALTVLAF